MFYAPEATDSFKSNSKGESACFHCSPWGATGYVTKRDGRQTVCTACDGTGLKGVKPTEMPARLVWELGQREESS